MLSFLYFFFISVSFFSISFSISPLYDLLLYLCHSHSLMLASWGACTVNVCEFNFLLLCGRVVLSFRYYKYKEMKIKENQSKMRCKTRSKWQQFRKKNRRELRLCTMCVSVLLFFFVPRFIADWTGIGFYFSNILLLLPASRNK